ncbi:MAG TPA: sterol desaturase family protein [Bacteroidia bacterium]|nr:sterol desaturase family protein [Bacteroidia bacterium]
MQAFSESLLFLITTPMYVIFIGLEIIVSNLHRNERYSKLGFFENMYLMFINIFVDLGMRVIALFVLSNVFAHHVTQITNPWIYWPVVIVAVDFAFWVIHYVDHNCRLFWAVHVTHHSSQEFNLSVGLRSSLFEPVYRFIYFIPLAFLGFKAQDIFFGYSITQLYGVFIHTQYVPKLGFFEKFLSTPSHHRVHHGANVKYLDRNMGMFLIVWDKLFGTFQAEEEKVVYGLTKNIESHHPANVIFHEFKSIYHDVRKAPGFRNKLMYIFGPPGWSHDGSKKTSKQLREEAGLKR